MRPSTRDTAELMYVWGHRRQDLRLLGTTTGERSVEETRRFIGYHWMKDRLRPALNAVPARIITRNKWVYHQVMARFQVPVPRTIGLYDPVHGITWDGERRLRTPSDVIAEIERQQLSGVVFKPAGGQQGTGVVILDEIDHRSGEAVLRTGEQTTLSRAVAGLDVTGMGDSPGCLVQEPVPSHPRFAELAPWTTNTLRIVTLVGLDGEARLLDAVTPLGRKGRMANNWHAGGVNVGIDIESGTMRRGVLFDPVEWVEVHPDTGMRFTGEPVPGWTEAVQACLTAAVLFPGVRCIGWDVVVGPQGPVLLEANDGWDLQMAQVHSDGYLADPRIREMLVAAGAPLPTGRALEYGPRRLSGQTRATVRGLAAQTAARLSSTH